MITSKAFPTVHMNGTSRQSLLENYQSAIESLENAHNALCNAAPHMRDYYVKDDAEDAFKIARQEHGDRLLNILKAMEQLRSIAENVAAQ